jgi:hypothetical protein
MRKILFILFASGYILNSCCDKDFITPTLDYDFREGALDVTSLVGSTCTISPPDYSTAGATADGEAGSCWTNSGPLHNRWFKFQAPASANGTITIYVGSVNGTQRRTSLVLFDTDGVTEISCSKYGADDDIVSMYNSYTAGQYYYFSVDVEDSPSVGTFSMCLTDTD